MSDTAFRAFLDHVRQGRTVTDREYPTWSKQNLELMKAVGVECDALPVEDQELRSKLIYEAAASAPFRRPPKDTRKVPNRVATVRAENFYADLRSQVNSGELKE